MMRALRVLPLLIAVAALPQELPRGEIVDNVKCAADQSQSYALYVPSHYSKDRQWSLILAFDARGRGRAPVEQYKAAAEKYGYIVAGSNNSRNGPPQVSLAAAQAMWEDVVKRFSINPKRMYTAGHSGGARIAMKVAIDSNQIAGVFASSAGFPPGHRRSELQFAVFGTAGTEDFNYLEMRQLDQELSSPHRVVVFQGGHTWLPSELAVEAVEWMEVQAMKSGRSARDEALLQKILAARAAQASSQKDEASAWEALNALSTDFQGLTDVSKYAAQAHALQQKKSVLDALNKEHEDQEFEAQIGMELADLQEGLLDGPEARAANFSQLKDRLTRLSQQANGPADSSERRMARRLMSGIFIDSRGVDDQEYQKFVDGLRPPVRN
ncbi:MAG: alpha/beta hydrolase [Acidobacteriia bacterium]|nr:alpha/beta hydrolase [Terriglobia bacterium]